MCSLDEIDQICVEDQIFLFRRNLDNAEMMAYLHSFNQKTWTEELEFVLGKNDKMQWMVSPYFIQTLNLIKSTDFRNATPTSVDCPYLLW